MRRRDFLAVPAALLAGCAFGRKGPRVSSAARPEGVPAPRNVILISIDTLRADHMLSYGYPVRTTPVMDRFMAEGCQFLVAINQLPTTDPSHTTMLTGQPARVHGCTRNRVHIRTDAVTQLQTYAKRRGMQTAAITSRAHLCPDLGLVDFDYFTYPEYERHPPATNEDALSWLRSHHEDPFFLFLHYWEPHAPYSPPEKYVRAVWDQYAGLADRPELFNADRLAFLCQHPGQFGPADPSKGARGFTPAQREDMNICYDADAGWSDEYLGVFLRELDRLGRRDDTLVILTADHGESLDELIERYNYAYDHGEFLYEHQIHIPLGMRYPPLTKPRTRVRRMVHHEDIVPTVLSLWGLDPDGPLPGRSLLPLISGGQADLGRRYVFLQLRTFSDEDDLSVPGYPEGFFDSSQYCVRGERWKLIWSIDGQVELYDLRTDPAERRNVADDNPRLVSEMTGELMGWLRRTRGMA